MRLHRTEGYSAWVVRLTGLALALWPPVAFPPGRSGQPSHSSSVCASAAAAALQV